MAPTSVPLPSPPIPWLLLLLVSVLICAVLLLLLLGAQDPGEHGKMGQSEDRAMYEVRARHTSPFVIATRVVFGLWIELWSGLRRSMDCFFLFVLLQDGGGRLDDYCSITIDGSGGLSEDIIQQRLQSLVHQREELQRLEMELRAQVIAHPQIIEAQRSFEAAAKEHVTAAAKLKVLILLSTYTHFVLPVVSCIRWELSTCNLLIAHDLACTAVIGCL
jgi:hypothetical protein